jgi:heme/copper-type cytochrome/quinol oxidase subunit 2
MIVMILVVMMMSVVMMIAIMMMVVMMVVVVMIDGGGDGGDDDKHTQTRRTVSLAMADVIICGIYFLWQHTGCNLVNIDCLGTSNVE